MDERTRQAIARLTEALDLLSTVRDQGDTSSIPLTVGPDSTPIVFTARTAEAIADAIDSMNAYMASEGVHDNKLGMAVREAELAGWLEGQSSEHIQSGEWSAAAVAQNNPDLYGQITKFFDGIDPLSYLDDVLTSYEPEAAAAAYEQLITGEWDGDL